MIQSLSFLFQSSACVCNAKTMPLTALGLSLLSPAEGFDLRLSNLVHQDVALSMVFFFICISRLFCIFKVCRADEKARGIKHLHLGHRFLCYHAHYIRCMAQSHEFIVYFSISWHIWCCPAALCCNQACGEMFLSAVTNGQLCFKCHILRVFSVLQYTNNNNAEAFKWIFYASTMELVKL